MFIGANIDAVETAGRYGIASDRAVNYNADERGTRVLYFGDVPFATRSVPCPTIEQDIGTILVAKGTSPK